MRRGRRALAAVLACAALAGGPALAQEGRFFACDRIVFFGPCAPGAAPAPEAGRRAEREAAGETRPAPAPGRTVERESLWAEPVRRPDGAVEVWVPPRPVREFLEDPSPERAMAYLEWNQRRLEAFDRAAAVLRDVARGAAPTAGLAPAARAAAEGPAPAPAPDAARRSGVSVVLAFAAWCPYSQRQLPVIDRLAARVPVAGVVFDSSEAEVEAVRRAVRFDVVPGTPALRARLGVTSYPTVLIYDGGRPVRVLRGLQTPEALDAALAAAAGAASQPIADAGATPATCRAGG